ncbi:flagellar biosynthetic protein FliR [Alkaliphilus serpentinus]|uniref:Flagellar biosynthetic protein FliR n=1 Tax=Alkaliphilus serpentinus TaxID=1482731 RepID=A0A833MEI0_9FIRM|nr:flagellar biosynthetic protein FliR [Alkaliphilus serpentinus]KAB3531369.1 flagellar type III secretion system protein FliR [Alkaliphilus serpentinus]
MTELITFISNNFILFLLLVVRTTGIFVAAPVFSRSTFPALLKIGLSVAIAFILLPIVGRDFIIEADNLLILIGYSINEFLIGIIIGFISFTYFSVLYLAGTIIDTQMGFGMVNVFDPQTNAQIPVMGNFYNNVVSMLFIVVNGHHLLIRALVYSYNLLPVGFSLSINSDGVTLMTRIMTEMFIMAIKFAAPVLVVILLSTILLGVLARTMPQMNVFIVGIPLKIAVGIISVIITLQYIVPFSNRLFDRMFSAILEMMKILARG